MKKAYSIIMTIIALALLGYILLGNSSKPDQVQQRTQAASANYEWSSPTATPRAVATRYARSSATSPPAVQSYILNKNTKKFHYSWCPSVAQMKEKNKRTYEGTRTELISMGYSPCGNCHP